MQEGYSQMQEEQGKAGTFLVGLICGAAIGAAVGLMLAPKAGVEIRRQLADQAEKLRKQAADAYGSASSAIGDVLSRSREAVNVGREAYEQTRSSANGAARDMAGV